tara:strand:+ start:275 stop:730 length:456 start_codon:yes stop_codon:yes gene_type:complete
MELTELDALIQAKEKLSNVPLDKQSVEYENINFKINCLIHKKCDHNIVFDNIDIDIDRSETICYCTECYLTFNVYFIKDFILSTLNHSKRDIWKIITPDGIFDLTDIYVKNNWLYFQLWNPGYNSPINTIKFTLKDVLNCAADNTNVYLKN